LHHHTKDPIFKDILTLLIENGANFKKRDENRWTPMSIAVSYDDEEIIRMMYNFYLKSREERIKRNNKKIAECLGTMKDLYMELKWKVSIPILSFLCPNDVIKIWKRKDELRADFTFVDYKTLRVIRNLTSILIKYNKAKGIHELLKANHVKKEYYDFAEPLEQDEIELVLKEVMTKKRMNGSFKIIECRLEETEEDGKKVFEEVNGWKAQKYQLNLKVKIDRNPTEIVEYDDLNEENYLNKEKNIIKKRIAFGEHDLKENLEQGLHIKNTFVTKGMSELEKEKTLKAYVWVILNCPINSQDAVNLLESIGPANQFMDKVKEFFEHPDLQEIIKKNGFPIKIIIPYNIFIDLTFSFKQFKVLDPNCKELVDLFKPFDSFEQHKRKDCQKLYKNYKTRVFYANIK
jgi:hypothetical protein